MQEQGDLAIRLHEYFGLSNPDEIKIGFGHYKAIYTKTINVLLIGRSQTGKSTIARTLTNPHMVVKGRGFSETRKPVFTPLSLYDERTKETYVLNILDTPGLSEKRLNNEESRKDEEIMKLAVLFIKKNITYLNVVCFVSKIGLTHELDTDVFLALRNFLGTKYSNNSMLVLTNCDQKDDNTIESYIQDLSKHEPTKEILKYCQLGVFRFGTIDFDEIQKNRHLVDLDTQKKMVFATLSRIEGWRNALIEKIVACSNRITVDELDAVHKQDEEHRNELIKEKLLAADLERQKKYKLDVQKAKEEAENNFAKKNEEKQVFFNKWHEIGQKILETNYVTQWDIVEFENEIQAQKNSHSLSEHEETLWKEWFNYNKQYFQIALEEKKSGLCIIA